MLSSVNDICSFYCLSYKNEQKKINMSNRFSQLNINVEFYDGVGFDDKRLSIPLINKDELKHKWSSMYGHLDMINKFVKETDKEYAVFCEDDIYLDKNLANDIPILIQDFKIMKLDVLLLGYLTKYKIEDFDHQFSVKKEYGCTNNKLRKYHNYYNYLRGSQMYMLSRSHAQSILEKYYSGYAEKTLNTDYELSTTLQPFYADWTITKNGNRAIVYPMYAVEDAGPQSGHIDDYNQQHIFHRGCFNFNYNRDTFI